MTHAHQYHSENTWVSAHGMVACNLRICTDCLQTQQRFSKADEWVDTTQKNGQNILRKDVLLKIIKHHGSN